MKTLKTANLKAEDLKKIVDFDINFDYEITIEIDLDDKLFNIPIKELLNNEDLITSLHSLTMSDYKKHSKSWTSICRELYRKDFEPSWDLVKKIYETESEQHMLNAEMENTILLVDKQQMLLEAIRYFENKTDDDNLEIINNIIKIEKNNPKVKIDPKITHDTLFYSRSWLMPYNILDLCAIDLLAQQEIDGRKTTIKIDKNTASEIKDGLELCKNVVYYEKLKNNETLNNDVSATANECYFVFLKNSLKERDRMVKKIKNLQNKFIEAQNSDDFCIQYEPYELPKQGTLESIHNMDEVIIDEFNRIIKTANEEIPALYDKKNDVIKLKIDDDFNNCLFITDEDETETEDFFVDSYTVSSKKAAMENYIDSCIYNNNDNHDLNYVKEIKINNETKTLTK